MRRLPSPLHALVVAGLVVGLAAPALGQEAPPTTECQTTTTTDPSEPCPTTTTTTAPPPPPPPTTLVPPPPGSQPPPPESTTTTPPPDAGDQDSPPETVPVSDQTIPPPPGAPVDGGVAERLIQKELRVAKADVLQSEAEVAAAAQLVDELSTRLADLQAELARLDVAQSLAVQALEEAEVRFKERVANAVRGNAAELDTIVTATDANDLEMRKVFLASVSEADRESVVDLREAKSVIDDGVLDALETLARTRRELRSARQGLQSALMVNTERKFQLAVFSAGSQIVIRGFVFPVGEPYSFIDSWGFPRMVGTEYEHGHQGTDIMAPFGTPLYAVERGIITRVGTDVLGGTKLWLKGQSGTYYYYAHMQSYAEGMVEGALVNAGDVVGYNGASGNAQGGAPHLHLQVHPVGGEPVNPYGLLKVVSDLSRSRSR